MYARRQGRSSALARSIPIALLLAAGARTASASTPDFLYDESIHGRTPPSQRGIPEPLGPFNYVREFDQIVGFLAVWQVSDMGSPDYGGMIEAEGGPLGGVIQTDNTLEAIWCWSRYRALTGDTSYDDNLAAAWIYVQNFPAWDEEGDPGNDYYRVHNCAWALTAALEYEAATGDASFAGYAATAAQYIADTPLDLTDGTTYQQRLDAFVKGWAAGNLYRYAEALSDPVLLAEALTQGLDVFGWLDFDPATRLGLEYWAMSSGTALWGVCNSVFADDPALGVAWLTANAPFLDTWQEWIDIPGFDWDSAWNVAYLNAHWAVYEILGDAAYRDNAIVIADRLLSFDTDDDGGIMAQSVEPDTEDASWVTSYLCKFGVDRLVGTPLPTDVGTLRFDGLADGDMIEVGQPIDVAVIATNFGLDDQLGATVELSGDAGGGSTSVDLPFAALVTETFVFGWTPPVGTYTLTGSTTIGGDGDPTNDVVSITIHVVEAIGVPGDVASTMPLLARPPVTPFRGTVVFELVPGVAPTEILIVGPGGALVRRAVTTGNRWRWDGRDERGRPVASGVYTYALGRSEARVSGKLVRRW